MADYGTAVLPARRNPIIPALPVGYTTYQFGSAVLPAGGGASPAPGSTDTRAPGDYLARFFGGIAPTARTAVYQAKQNVRGVIRHIRFVNPNQAAATVSVWVGGVLLENALSVPAGGKASQDVSEWLVGGGETIDLRASASGIYAAIYGVEEVLPA
ncbi:hypothetical protein [Rubrobacter calidifluminis]|uniref:hypothetical protein n=1 Tax=Rubrobacter calidifluminis TaxID=1392640 RepID=UPI00235F5CDA|nr:hypothetical protein [Rubrobacter calidifluminis]